MIKLNRTLTPIYLTPTNVDGLTNAYLTNGSNVWNDSRIKEPLFGFSECKCAFCEKKFGPAGGYLEVEHLKHRDLYPELVLDWDNLIPSCKTCNLHKGIHDVELEPIIDPFVDYPGDHLFFKDYRLNYETDLGKTTIGALNLNDTKKHVMPRFEIGQKIYDSIDDLWVKIERYLERQITQRRNKIISHYRNLLMECLPDSEYSAVCATVLHSSDLYQQCVTEMRNIGIWDDQFEDYHLRAEQICLFE